MAAQIAASLAPPRLSGSAVAGVRGWLVVVAGGGESRDQGSVRCFSGSGPSAHLLSLFIFFLILLGFGFAALFFAIAVLLDFPTHPLHSPSRIDRGELPGVAAMRLRLAGPGCLLGGALGGLAGMRLLLAAPGCLFGGAPLAAGQQLQRRDTGNNVDSIDRLNTRHLGAVH